MSLTYYRPAHGAVRLCRLVESDGVRACIIPDGWSSPRWVDADDLVPANDAGACRRRGRTFALRPVPDMKGASE